MPFARPLVLGLWIASAGAQAWAGADKPPAEPLRVPVAPHSSATFPLAAGEQAKSPRDESDAPGLATMALDPADGDPGQSACSDFEAHAQGRWQQENPIPSTWNAWGTWTQLEARQLEQLRSLIERAAEQAAEDPVAAQVSTFYAAAMNAGLVDQLGSDPVWPLVEEIDALAKPADFLAFLAREHRNGREALFRLEVRGPGPDQDKATLALVPAPLGLPDLRTYTQPSREATGLLGTYEAHISRTLQLARISKIGAQTAAESVRAIETRLARALVGADSAVVPGERLTPAELAERHPGTDWTGYLAALGLNELQQVELVQPAFFAEIEALLAEMSPETWRDYLRWSVVRPMAPYLSVGFTDAEFLLYQSTLGGRHAPEPRWRRMTRLTAWAFPQWLGRRYLQEQGDEGRALAAREIADALRERFGAQIEATSWLSPESRRHAREALDALEIAIAEPVRWPGANDADIVADDLVGNIRRTQARQMKRELARLGAEHVAAARAPDHTLFAVGITYDADSHRLSVPLALLQPPMLETAARPALNLGAFGALLGAAMHQAVETRASPRWTAAERRQREQQRAALGARYAEFRIEGARIDAGRAAPLALADLAGLSLALDALAAVEDDQKAEFFAAWARLWRGQQRLQAIRTDLLAGGLPWRLRATGPLGHLPEFLAAFDCEAGRKGLPSAEDRIRPW
jgi:putative endopeptidase